MPERSSRPARGPARSKPGDTPAHVIGEPPLIGDPAASGEAPAPKPMPKKKEPGEQSEEEVAETQILMKLANLTADADSTSDIDEIRLATVTYEPGNATTSRVFVLTVHDPSDPHIDLARYTARSLDEIASLLRQRVRLPKN